MSRILVVDDDPSNRKILSELLGDSGHHMLEACDGAEALESARVWHPDLIITDILMPTMDGYEFIRQLRADPTIADTHIIFYTAHYLEHQARLLADVCGASFITKPSSLELILHKVEAALELPCSSPPPLPVYDFDREHLRLVTDKLFQKARELRAVNQQLAALVELGQQLAAERAPLRILDTVCHAARDIIGAQYAGAGVLTDDGETLLPLCFSGLDPETVARIGPAMPRQGMLDRLLTEGCPIRVGDVSADWHTLGLPSPHPPIYSFGGTPITSPTQRYGVLYVANKLGGGEFDAEDMDVLGTIAAQVGVAYENARRYHELQHYTTRLEQEVGERQRAEEQVRGALREKEVLLQEIHHRVKNNLQIVSSLLSLQSRYVQDPRARELFKDGQHRIKSMALVHQQLYQSQDLSGINFGAYIQHLAADLFRSYGIAASHIHLQTALAEVSLGIDRAIPCGLILQELLSNCLKHAFPANATGEVSIELESDGNRRVTLRVRDTGVGLPAGIDLQNPDTLGLQLVGALVDQLEGTLDVGRSPGATFTLTFPG